MESKSIGFYIHIPFCIQKCKYCGFTSFSSFSEINKQNYVEKLISEIQLKISKLKNRKVKWIYIGGGTPNTLSIELLKKIVSVLPKDFEELSIELNPGASDSLEYLKNLKELGFNRISIGVQSFNDSELVSLGRIHNSRQAIDFINDVKSAGFQNFNIDLIIGIPNQTEELLQKSLQTAIDLNPTHISAYMLSIDEGTVFSKLYSEGNLNLPSDENFEKLYYFTVETLEKSGYLQYEVSNFSKKGSECKYNLNTWENGEYIGCGISAGSFVDNARFDNTKDLKKYIDEDLEILVSDSEEKGFVLNKKEDFENALMLGLRLRCGVDLENLIKDLDENYKKEILSKIEVLIKEGFLIRADDLIKISQDKILMLDYIVNEILI